MPTDLDIEKCLRRTVLRLWDDWDPEADFDINVVRKEAEKELGFEKGYFSNDLFWNVKSRTIMLAAADVLWCSSEKSPPQSADCFLLQLPQELQVIIFKMAFITSDSPLRTESIGGWGEDCMERSVDDVKHGAVWTWPEPCSFPRLQVEKFLVSKAFFETAAKTYVELQWVDLRATLISSGRTIAEQPRSILCRWATKVHIPSDWSVHADVLSSDNFAALRWLDLEVLPCRFYSNSFRGFEVEEEADFDPDEAWKKVLSDEQLSCSTFATDLSRVRGLVGVKLFTPPEHTLGPTDSTLFTTMELKIWRDNLSRLQELITRLVSRPRLLSGEDWGVFQNEEYREFGRELMFERFLNETREPWA
ncbi:hypothetical protein TI39_contig4175g00015 [Zymoseptoria brevis]|uniref:Uncharacterized protein n=1 Tax=Zymoseptoria brevis TaxID=1047168 RepID=A0A0F4GAZ8_9PEZI|nr:hypothetical protein TI39_contig4175g00015 [Zymoseptoria brevis]